MVVAIRNGREVRGVLQRLDVVLPAQRHLSNLVRRSIAAVFAKVHGVTAKVWDLMPSGPCLNKTKLIVNPVEPCWNSPTGTG